MSRTDKEIDGRGRQLCCPSVNEFSDVAEADMSGGADDNEVGVILIGTDATSKDMEVDANISSKVPWGRESTG